jgi:glycosyltransferase involved in cell wall biosynthesis
VKRILLLIKGLARGGAEQLLLNGAPYHDGSRFGYTIAYVLPSKATLVGALEAAGLRVVSLEGEHGAGWVWRLRKLVRQERIDLVHSHSAYAALGARLGLGPRRPKLVYTEHAVWELHRKPTYWANLLTFHRANHVFAVSDHVNASIRYPRALRFLPMPPVETLYHGIDLAAVDQWGGPNGVRQELGIPPEAPLIGSVANFEPMKGQEHLLRALVHVRHAIPEARTVLVGHGRFERQMRQRASRLGLSDTIIFTGYRADAPRVAGAFDVFVLPSVHEGLSIALIEAMAQGRPSVVTNVGGLPEVVRDGIDGLVVPGRNPLALASALVSLLRNPTLRQRMGEAARLRARNFDIESAVRRMEEVYAELLT